MGAGAYPIESPIESRRVYQGVDRGFIFFETTPGVPWRGILDVDVSETDASIESYYVDGKKIGQRFHKGVFNASVTSFDDPYAYMDDADEVYGFSYRETYLMGGKEYYRLHIIHGVTIRYLSSVRETINPTSPDATTYAWEIDSLDTDLRDDIFGSHLILDSSQIYPWSIRDVEKVLYKEARIPPIDEMLEIFGLMNLLIIDHGDGTWSAVGHDTMIGMLDSTEFQIVSDTIDFHEDDPQTFDIYDLIRDPRWLA